MYKNVSGINNLQELMCHKTKANHFLHSCWENNWIHSFPKVIISAIYNANIFVLDLNLVYSIHFHTKIFITQQAPNKSLHVSIYYLLFLSINLRGSFKKF